MSQPHTFVLPTLSIIRPARLRVSVYGLRHGYLTIERDLAGCVVSMSIALRSDLNRIGSLEGGKAVFAFGAAEDLPSHSRHLVRTSKVVHMQPSRTRVDEESV